MRVKEESEKPGLKLNIQKTKIIASSPITSWQVEKEKVEAVTDFIFLGSKITADGDCSHGIKRRLLLGRKAIINLDSILKNKEITLPTKVCLVKAMVFPVVMYRYECWTIKKAECQRNNAFKLWCCTFSPALLVTILLSSLVSIIVIKGSMSAQVESVQFSSVAQSCLTLCNPMDRSSPGLPVHHQLPEFTQTHPH